MNFVSLLTVLKSEDDARARLLADPIVAPLVARFASLGEADTAPGDISPEADLPVELCMSVLGLTRVKYRLEGAWLRNEREPESESETGERLSAPEVFKRFGGVALEEVEELGASDVTRDRSRT